MQIKKEAGKVAMNENILSDSQYSRLKHAEQYIGEIETVCRVPKTCWLLGEAGSGWKATGKGVTGKRFQVSAGFIKDRSDFNFSSLGN